MDSPMLIFRENKICIEVTDSYFYPIKEGDILLLKGKVVEYANGCLYEMITSIVTVNCPYERNGNIYSVGDFM